MLKVSAGIMFIGKQQRSLSSISHLGTDSERAHQPANRTLTNKVCRIRHHRRASARATRAGIGGSSPVSANGGIDHHRVLVKVGTDIARLGR